VQVLPAPGKPFEVFVAEVQECRNYAVDKMGYSPEDAAAHRLAETAAVATVIGGVAGALLGGHRGIGSGAATGLILGTELGVPAAADSGAGAQQRYDIAYEQCMYTKGNAVPGMPQPAPPPPPPPPPN